MAEREETSLADSVVIAARSRRSQCSGGWRGCAKESAPSGSEPAFISTKPPKIERAAEPDPRRASRLSSVGVSFSPAAWVAARASAAKAEADEARPDAAGKLFSEVTSAPESR